MPIKFNANPNIPIMLSLVVIKKAVSCMSGC
jgi:hypothetical protein